MRSKTSYFNKTVFLKTVTRFWPIWLSYLVIWVFIMPLNLGMNYSPNRDILYMHRDILEMGFMGGLVSGGITAAVSAMAVWSFMYQARSAHGMACLPIKREGVFASVTLAGFLPVCAANVLIAVLTLGVGAYNGLNLFVPVITWFALLTLFYMLFYGFAVFCAQLTGNIVVLPLVYAVLNFTVFVVESIIREIAKGFVYGLRSAGGTLFSFLSPAVQIVTHCGVERIRDADYEVIGYAVGGWGTIIAYAVVGLVFMALAMLLYKKRRMESASDVVAVNALKPVFKYCLTGGCALVLGWILYMMTESSRSSIDESITGAATVVLYMIIGAFVGYFAAEMLIRKSFRVWKGRWTGFFLSAAVIAALMFSLELDVFGFESRVPDADDIESVYLSIAGNGAIISDQEPELLARVTDIHRSIVENKGYYEELKRDYPNGYWSRAANIEYTLKNGKTMQRYYALRCLENQPASYRDIQDIQDFMNEPEVVLLRNETNREVTRDNIVTGHVTGLLPADRMASLLGYNDVEHFILSYYVGVAEEEIELLDKENRDRLILEAVVQNAYGLEKYYALSEEWKKYDDYSYVKENSDISYTEPQFYPADTPAYSADIVRELKLEDINFSEVYFQYTWTFSDAEAYDLYMNCIMPDVAEGKIGRLFLMEDDYTTQNLYAANIGIENRWLPDDATSKADYRYSNIQFRPEIISSRTVKWLTEHGVELYTQAQLGVYY